MLSACGLTRLWVVEMPLSPSFTIWLVDEDDSDYLFEINMIKLHFFTMQTSFIVDFCGHSQSLR